MYRKRYSGSVSNSLFFVNSFFLLYCVILYFSSILSNTLRMLQSKKFWFYQEPRKKLSQKISFDYLRPSMNFIRILSIISGPAILRKPCMIIFTNANLFFSDYYPWVGYIKCYICSKMIKDVLFTFLSRNSRLILFLEIYIIIIIIIIIKVL